jgi:hypothetical protein
MFSVFVGMQVSESIFSNFCRYAKIRKVFFVVFVGARIPEVFCSFFDGAKS